MTEIKDHLKNLREGVSNSQRDHEIIEAGIKAASTVTNYLNIIGTDERTAAFIGAMQREHRTLQQSFTGLCLAWISHLASQPDYAFDLRNEASRAVAKKIMAHLDKYDIILPSI